MHFTTDNSTEANRKRKGKEINNEAQAALLPPQLDSLKVVAVVARTLSAKSGIPFPISRNLSDTFRGGVFGILKILEPRGRHRKLYNIIAITLCYDFVLLHQAF